LGDVRVTLAIGNDCHKAWVRIKRH